MHSFCIIGLGKFGHTMAVDLAEGGKQVMIIDSDPSLVTPLADLVTNALIADPTQESVLRASGVADYDCAVVCEAKNVNDSVLITIMLKELGVKYVVARAVNEGHKKVLSRVGADLVTFPEQDAAERLAFTLARDKVSEYMEFKGYKLVEMLVPKKWQGKNLIELEIRAKYNVTVVAVTFTDGRVDASPAPTRKFAGGEKVTLVGDDHAIDSCIHRLAE